jgi:PIN domain nuclease of toxin-antitoxin system
LKFSPALTLTKLKRFETNSDEKAIVFHHRDPFDRMWIAQAIGEWMHVLSRKGCLSRSPIERMW